MPEQIAKRYAPFFGGLTNEQVKKDAQGFSLLLSEIVERLDEIREEFCPSSLEDLQAAMDAGYNDLCGCAICALCRDLMIAEINEMSLAVFQASKNN